MGYASYPKGHPSNPMTDDELKKKFMYASRSVLDEKRVEQVIEMLDKLEEVSDINNLVQLLH